VHELSIAMNLVSLADDAVASAELERPPRIEAVRVRIGDLSGVVIEALEFAWDVAREGTSCHRARLEVERIAARIRCEPCRGERNLVAGAAFRCPDCGTPSAEILAGRELDLTALELGDELPAGEPAPSRDHTPDPLPETAHVGAPPHP